MGSIIEKGTKLVTKSGVAQGGAEDTLAGSDCMSLWTNCGRKKVGYFGGQAGDEGDPGMVWENGRKKEVLK